MREFRFAGATAVVTGAASGIGEAVARNLAVRDTHLALVDVDAEGLELVGDDLRRSHPHLTISTHVVDLSERSDFADLVMEIGAGHERVTLLVNNAGVALGGSFADLSLEDIDWVMMVNFRAVVAMTKAFLPALTIASGAHIVNVSSLFGLIAPAGQSAYAASKFAVRGFSEALRGELEPRGVGVTVVHPGGIATNIAKNARLGAGVDPAKAGGQRRQIGAMLTMPAYVAAELILDAVRSRRGRLVITRQAKALDRMQRLLPDRYVGMVNRAMRRRR